MSNNLLSLLGLALRGGNLSVGEEPVEAEARAKKARVILLASDAASNTRRRAEHFAVAGNTLWLAIPCTKAELGHAVGKNAVAMVAVTDIGLANAVVQRLAQESPEQYGEAAERMEVKAKRAAERKKEQLVHEKKLKRGIRTKKEPVVKDREETPFKEEVQEETPRKPFRRSSRPAGPRSTSSHPNHTRGSRRAPTQEKRNPYANSRPVKKGKGSVKKTKPS